MASAPCRALAFLAPLLWYTVARAVPAPDVPLEIPLPNGESLVVRLEGDDFGLVVETLDGYTLAPDRDGNLTYAVRGPDGRLAPSGVRPPASPAPLGVQRHLRPGAAELERIDAARLAANEARRVHPRLARAGATAQQAAEAESAAGSASALAATATPFRLAVVLVDFPDVPRTYTADQLRQVFFGAPGEYRTSPSGRTVTGSDAE
jgi:hypothetical protein